MAYSPVTDFGLQVSRGSISGWIGVEKFGRNADVDAAEDIWGNGGDWVAPTAARVHSIVSSSANDTSAGTGARTVTVNGLDGSYVDTTETVTMNGVTPVNTANSYVIIHRMVVATAGTGLTNAGTITATAATDATISCTIQVGFGQSQFCIYQIPANYTGYLFAWRTSFQNSVANSSADVCLFTKPDGGAWNLKSSVGLSSSGSSAFTKNYTFPLSLAAKTTVKVRCVAVANANADIQAGFSILLIPV